MGSVGGQQGGELLCGGGQQICVQRGGRRDGRAVQRTAQGSNMLRRGAAAAAEDHDAGGQHVRHQRGELLRRAVVHRLAVHDGGHAGVGLGDQGDAGVLPQAAELGQHLVRPRRAVETEGVDAHALQYQQGGGDVGAGDAAAILVAGKGDEDGLGGDAAHGQHGGTGVGQGHHGLNDVQVHTGGFQSGCLLGVGVHQLVEGGAAQRGQKQAGGRQVSGQQGLAVRGLTGQVRQTAVIGGGVLRYAVLRQLHGIAAEGGGVEHLAAGGHVIALDGQDAVRMGQHPLLRADVAGVAALLQLRTGGTVQNKGKTQFHM